MFNMWIVYEPAENLQSEILSAILFRLTKGNRRDRYCTLVKNMGIYKDINENPRTYLSRMALLLANLLKKLQESKVVHGDLRPETLISNPNFSSLHLINFNHSRKFKDIKPEEYLLQLQYSCWNYLPPEVFQYIYNCRYWQDIKRLSLLEPI